ncbi:response regulator transcription factor [Leucothrix pacifica]|uniref:DNA-binding response regulator n=1 Tax=Leucothrix pacifica TaxID=1247513 RepID=A0A317CMF4_9GAMM|nr:response regulator transcription factor [Leucothrix pacifica]PWQ99401.1 DNA-binding response regulator [Leucothrix pacifica]
MQTVLLIDDDEQLAGPLREYFARYDLNLINETHPERGLQRLKQSAADPVSLVILDVMMPDMDGFEVCRTIRRDEQFKDLPVLMLTARGEVMDRVIGLELGADDYLAKPFEPRELVARIHNIFRRVQTKTVPPGTGENSTHFRHLKLDEDRLNATIDGSPLELTTSEFSLLLLLAKSPGKAFTRDDILNELRGIDAELFTRSVDILVSRLRQKLKPLRCIQTVWGSGYRFIEAEA